MAFIPCKNQFYVNDGFGRDTYIYNNNGGFAFEKLPTKIHEVGKFTEYFNFIRKLYCIKASCLEPVGPYSFKAHCLHK